MTCRFYRLVPKHINSGTKNIKNYPMFSKNGKFKKLKIIQYTMFRLLNTEITYLHTKIIYQKKQVKKACVLLEKTVGVELTTLFINYYNTKLNFITGKIKDKLENKLNRIYFEKYKHVLEKDRYRAKPLNDSEF